MNSKDFFIWCESNGLISNKEISEAFNVSAQTIRNWKKKGELPLWVHYASIALESGQEVEVLNFTDFKNWQRENGISTYEETGNAFGIQRQAVHQWFRRGRFPKWLSLACFGYNLKQQFNI